MKTILTDAVYCIVSDNGEIFQEMIDLLETYRNNKIVLTNASYDKFSKYSLDKLPYQIFTLEHNPEKTDPRFYNELLSKFKLTKNDVIYFEHNLEAVKSAESVGIKSYLYDDNKKDLEQLKKFLDNNL